MLVSGVFLVGTTAIVRHVGVALPAAEGAFIRYLIGLGLMLPFCVGVLRRPPTRRQMGLFAGRGAVHSIAVALWFYAMAHIPIAEVTAMGYLSPVFVTLLAVLFLGERVRILRVLAMLVALIGALVILRPGMRELMPAHYAMFLVAAMFAVSHIIAKVVSDETSPQVVVVMLSFWVTIGLAPMAAYVWITPTWDQVGWMGVTAVIATAQHFTMTMALRAAPITVTQPVTFLQLIWATAMGYFVFGEAIDMWVIAGGSLILAAIIFITLREHRLNRRAITPPSGATKF